MRKNRWFLLVLLAILMLPCVLVSCFPDYNAPADHEISEHGVMHKEGYENPEVNCASCHGSDLKGGNVSVSCFECHGDKWSD